MPSKYVSYFALISGVTIQSEETMGVANGTSGGVVMGTRDGVETSGGVAACGYMSPCELEERDMVGGAGWSPPGGIALCAGVGRTGSPDGFATGTSPGGKAAGRVSPSRHRDAKTIAWKGIC